MINKITKTASNRRGQASLLITFIVMTLLLFVALFLTELVLKQTKVTSNIYNSLQAYYLADTGTEVLIYRINLSIGDPDRIDPGDYNVGDVLLSRTLDSNSSFSVVKTSDSPLKMRISGVYKNVARAVELSW